MKKLPITLCVVTHNSADRLEEMVNKHKGVVSEVLIAVQDSTDGTFEIAEKVADVVYRRTRKGTSDPDRNWLFSQASNPWVLYLDDDEYLDESLIIDLKSLIEDNIDIYWLNTKNLVDGVDVEAILGEDPHPRLFKTGSITFTDEIHTWPKPKDNTLVAFVNYCIVHDRSLDKIKKANRGRNVIASPEAIQSQEDFISKCEALLKKKNTFELVK
jgi:glycosyltransferase involved in cell wall biosynthesis